MPSGINGICLSSFVFLMKLELHSPKLFLLTHWFFFFTHTGPMNTERNVLVHREGIKLLLQQGFPSHSPPSHRKMTEHHAKGSPDTNPTSSCRIFAGLLICLPMGLPAGTPLDNWLSWILQQVYGSLPAEFASSDLLPPLPHCFQTGNVLHF